MDSANLENLLQLKISRFTADTSGAMLSFSLAHQGVGMYLKQKTDQ